MEHLRKRAIWKVEDSISVFSIAIENKENYFRLRQRKQTNDFYKEYFQNLEQDFSSIKNHVDNLRRAYRKRCINLRSTGNNDEKEELNGSEELFDIIKQYEAFFGSNIAPHVIVEPGAIQTQKQQQKQQVCYFIKIGLYISQGVRIHFHLTRIIPRLYFFSLAGTSLNMQLLL